VNFFGGAIKKTSIDILFNHRIKIISGVRGKECGDLLIDIFKSRRSQEEN